MLDAAPVGFGAKPLAERFYPAIGKRLFDLFLLAAFAPVYLPLIAVLWLIVRLDGGPGFFSHSRVGRDGKMFACYKIRSMIPNAEAALARHLDQNPAAKAEWQANFKLEHDFRITPIGRFLRKTSLDELPQLFNVFRGDMSLVGPRPVTVAELSLYGPYLEEAYSSIRPGVTGMWQVGGRNSVDYATRVSLDRAYARNIGPLRDLSLILRTVVHVLLKKGK
jgi:exopolysaccharide production protein ExoY